MVRLVYEYCSELSRKDAKVTHLYGYEYEVIDVYLYEYEVIDVRYTTFSHVKMKFTLKSYSPPKILPLGG